MMISFITAARLCAMAECETRQAVDGRWYTQEEFRNYYQQHAVTMWRRARQPQRRLEPRICDAVGPGASEHTADSDGALDRGASEHTCLLAIRAKESSCGLPAVGVAKETWVLWSPPQTSASGVRFTPLRQGPHDGVYLFSLPGAWGRPCRGVPVGVGHETI